MDTLYCGSKKSTSSEVKVYFMKVVWFDPCYCSKFFSFCRNLKIRGNFGPKNHHFRPFFRNWRIQAVFGQHYLYLWDFIKKTKKIGTVKWVKPDNFHEVTFTWDEVNILTVSTGCPNCEMRFLDTKTSARRKIKIELKSAW